jgi:hypothetical protein
MRTVLYFLVLLASLGVASAESTRSLPAGSHIIVYDVHAARFLWVRKPFSRGADLFKQLKAMSSVEVLDASPSAPMGTEITLYVVNFHVGLYDATIKGETKASSEKVPDLLKTVFGDKIDLSAVGGQGAPPPLDKTFIDNLEAFELKINDVKEKYEEAVTEPVARALSTQTYYADFANEGVGGFRQVISALSLPKPVDRKKIGEGLAEAFSALERSYLALTPPRALIFKYAFEAAKKRLQDTKVALGEYDKAAVVWNKTAGNSDEGIDADSAFGEYFMSEKPETLTVTGDYVQFKINLTPKGKGLLQGMSASLRIQPQSGSFRLSFSTGLAFFSIRDEAFGKETSGSNLVIVRKGSQNQTVTATSAFVHALFGTSNNEFRWGPTFGIGTREEKPAYFGGLTLAFGSNQRLMLIGGMYLAPGRTLDGMEVGDPIGEEVTIPTKFVNRQGFFLAISYKF